MTSLTTFAATSTLVPQNGAPRGGAQTSVPGSVFALSFPGFAAFGMSNLSVAEKMPVGTTVGTFNLPGGQFSYSLVSGTGDDDNALFTISGDTLKTGAVFDAADRSTYSIRVRITDPNGVSVEQPLTIQVTPNKRTEEEEDETSSDESTDQVDVPELYKTDEFLE